MQSGQGAASLLKPCSTTGPARGSPSEWQRNRVLCILHHRCYLFFEPVCPFIQRWSSSVTGCSSSPVQVSDFKYQLLSSYIIFFLTRLGLDSCKHQCVHIYNKNKKKKKGKRCSFSELFFTNVLSLITALLLI